MTVSDGIAVGVGAFFVSLLATPLAARFAARVGLVDWPGPLKPQTRATPYLGGVGLGCGLALGAAVLNLWLFVPLAMALALGTADDLRPLPPLVRLLGVAATGLVLSAVVSTRFGAAGFILVPLAAVVLVNGCNLLDGLDALCGAVVAVAAAGFGLLLTGDARSFALALVGATAAFLVFNRPPARLYLGDGGSYLVGLGLTILLTSAWAPGVPNATAVGALGVVALPVVEVSLAVRRRALSGRSLFAGDRDHPYDVMVRSGWSIGRTVGAYALAELGVVAIAIAASHLRTPLALALTVVAFAGLVAVGLGAQLRSPYRESTDGRPT